MTAKSSIKPLLTPLREQCLLLFTPSNIGVHHPKSSRPYTSHGGKRLLQPVDCAEKQLVFGKHSEGTASQCVTHAAAAAHTILNSSTLSDPTTRHTWTRELTDRTGFELYSIYRFRFTNHHCRRDISSKHQSTRGTSLCKTSPQTSP